MWTFFVLLAGTGTGTRGGTPEGYREAETLRMTDRLSKVCQLLVLIIKWVLLINKNIMVLY